MHRSKRGVNKEKSAAAGGLSLSSLNRLLGMAIASPFFFSRREKKVLLQQGTHQTRIHTFIYLEKLEQTLVAIHEYLLLSLLLIAFLVRLSAAKAKITTARCVFCFFLFFSSLLSFLDKDVTSRHIQSQFT